MNTQNIADAMAPGRADPAVAELEDPAVAELDATRKGYDTLKPLTSDARARVLSHVSRLLEMSGIVQPPRQQGRANGAQADVHLQREQRDAPKFSSLAALFGAAGPKTQAQQVLVGGYWLEVCQGAETFDRFSANKEKKQLGQGVRNVPAAIPAL